jgi:hypothetical protein
LGEDGRKIACCAEARLGPAIVARIAATAMMLAFVFMTITPHVDMARPFFPRRPQLPRHFRRCDLVGKRNMDRVTDIFNEAGAEWTVRLNQLIVIPDC